MEMYSQVFTTALANPEANYEFWELLGDKISNSCLLKYFSSERFPEFRGQNCVFIFSRLIINYGSKESFGPIALSLGFDKFITSTENEKKTKREPMCEDTFEAFIGYTSHAIDTRVTPGAGYAICYNIISNIFRDRDVSIDYEDLMDSGTIFKETFDWAWKNARDGDAKFERLARQLGDYPKDTATQSFNRIKKDAERTWEKSDADETWGYKEMVISNYDGTQLGKGSHALKKESLAKGYKRCVKYIKI